MYLFILFNIFYFYYLSCHCNSVYALEACDTKTNSLYIHNVLSFWFIWHKTMFSYIFIKWIQLSIILTNLNFWKVNQ